MSVLLVLSAHPNPLLWPAQDHHGAEGPGESENKSASENGESDSDSSSEDIFDPSEEQAAGF